MCNGFIKLHRNINGNWIWQEKPFSRGQAWIDLLLMVNYKDNKILINGNLETVTRGSRITSLRQLSEKWGWSVSKVKKFLNLLQNDKMITYKSDTKKTLLTIENYDLYQSDETQKEHRKNTEKTQKENKKNSKKNQKETNKKDKERERKINKDKNNIYSDFELKILELYPGKKVKSVRDKKVPKLLKTYSVEELARCLERYSKECSTKDKQYILNESTFWNGRYMDYLDSNYKEGSNGTREHSEWNYQTSAYTPKSAEELDRECKELGLI